MEKQNLPIRGRDDKSDLAFLQIPNNILNLNDNLYVKCILAYMLFRLGLGEKWKMFYLNDIAHQLHIPQYCLSRPLRFIVSQGLLIRGRRTGKTGFVPHTINEPAFLSYVNMLNQQENKNEVLILT